MSNYFKDTCIAIEPGTISWLNPWAFFPLLLSTVGIILTLEVGSGLNNEEQIRQQQTLLFKAGCTIFVSWSENVTIYQAK